MANPQCVDDDVLAACSRRCPARPRPRCLPTRRAQPRSRRARSRPPARHRRATQSIPASRSRPRARFRRCVEAAARSEGHGECPVQAPEHVPLRPRNEVSPTVQTPAWGVDAVWRRGLPRRERRKGKVRAVMTGWRIATVSLCAACLMLPASAGAARIEIRPGAVAGRNQLVYTAGPGEVNSPGLQHQQDTYYLQDSRGPLTERVPPSGTPRTRVDSASSRSVRPGSCRHDRARRPGRPRRLRR